MQIKRHWFLVETMPFGYFFSGVDVFASGGALHTYPQLALALVLSCIARLERSDRLAHIVLFLQTC